MTTCIVSTLHTIGVSVWVRPAHTHYLKHLCGNGQYICDRVYTHTCLIPAHCPVTRIAFISTLGNLSSWRPALQRECSPMSGHIPGRACAGSCCFAPTLRYHPARRAPSEHQQLTCSQSVCLLALKINLSEQPNCPGMYTYLARFAMVERTSPTIAAPSSNACMLRLLLCSASYVTSIENCVK
jgi:hypothetical protein